MKAGRVDKGSTLVEVLMTLIISSWLATGLLTLYCTAAQGYTVLGAAVECQYTARSALDQIQADIHSALTLQIAADGASLDITAADRYVRLYRQNNQLYRWVTTAKGTTAIPIADHISSLTFSGNDQLVFITLSIASGECTRTLTTAAQSRL